MLPKFANNRDLFLCLFQSLIWSWVLTKLQSPIAFKATKSIESKASSLDHFRAWFVSVIRRHDFAELLINIISNDNNWFMPRTAHMYTYTYVRVHPSKLKRETVVTLLETRPFRRSELFVCLPLHRDAATGMRQHKKLYLGSGYVCSRN